MKYIQFKAYSIDSADTTRRYRNILAASGQELESGEVRDIQNLYVMTTEGKLVRVDSLNSDPDKQTEKYLVKAQADHGDRDIDGMPIPSIEKQFGSCRVWLDKDGLKARVYFAKNDKLADHAYAIAPDAAYSIGCDWCPDGYEGAGQRIDEPMGILREISMVITPNDPRSQTLDHKTIAKGSKGAATVDGNKTKGNTMSKELKQVLDALTPDERDALGRELLDTIDDFTTTAPENETQPTAKGDESKDEAPAAPAPAAEDKPATKTTDALGIPTDQLSIRPRGVIKQNDYVAGVKVKNTTDFKKTDDFNRIVRKSLEENGMTLDGFDRTLRRNIGKVFSADAINGVPSALPTEQMFISAIEGADGIISHVRKLNVKSFRAHFMTAGTGEAGRAHGHKPGDKKTDQDLNDAYRDILTKMIYKKNRLDVEMLYENPQLLNFTDDELNELIVAEIERGIVTGDGRTEPGEGAADYRIFDGTRGLWSIKTDAAATEGAGALAATTITAAAGDNLYDLMVKARTAIKAKGRLIAIVKSTAITDLLTVKSNNGYLVQPGTSLEQFLQVANIYTPEWMDADSNTGYVFAENQYGLIGESGINHRNSFDADYNTEVRLAEVLRGGSLLAAKAAVALAPAASK